ncbi:MAG: hypothetical protein M3067_16485 [Chloroflexota bacterium]|nr:hypothetical protein [Chloroflexota bacterium]
MEDQRWEPGMPVLDRQAAARRNLPPSLAALPPRSVPEVAPTPLQRQFVSLSVVALIAGAVAITALELGTPLASPLLKLCVVVAAPILLLTTADAAVRIWRSAWAWMPVNRGRALFRFSWLVVALLLIAIVVAAAAAVLTA